MKISEASDKRDNTKTQTPSKEVFKKEFQKPGSSNTADQQKQSLQPKKNADTTSTTQPHKKDGADKNSGKHER